jgi:molybdate/tungstate transport system substrate-binding protein
MNSRHKGLIICILASVLAATASGCTTTRPENQKTLLIFHAGSLSKSFEEIAALFESENPGVTVRLISSSSVEATKKVSELNQTADVVATTDWIPIQNYLYPTFTDWYGKFASDKMVVVYTGKSQFAREINTNNWYEILTMPGITVGRSNPDADPSGYRTLMVWKLAQQYYNRTNLYDRLAQNAPGEYVRQQDVDLVNSLKSGEIDYAWNYESIAKQNNLSYVNLPDRINLSNKTYESFYQTVSVTSAGQQVNGSLIEYGICVPKAAPDRELANRFVALVLSQKGRAVLAANFEPVLKPMRTVGQVPLMLAPFSFSADIAGAKANGAPSKAAASSSPTV